MRLLAMTAALVLFMISPRETHAQLSCAQLDGALVRSGEPSEVYLGFFGSSFALESIMNQFGTYGSRFSLSSVRNQFGSYGSQFALYSANNQFTSNPPRIYKNGVFLAYLTTNTLRSPAVSLAQIDNSCTFFASSPSRASVPIVPLRPAILTGLSASDGLFTDAILLTWNAAAGATGYNVYVSTSQDGERTLLGSTSATTERITGGTPGIIYYFFVFPTNAAGTSDGMWDSGYIANPPVASLLPQKHTERVDGSSSSARIAGGVRLTATEQLTEEFVAPAQVSIMVDIVPEPAHVGRSAALVVAIAVHGELYLLDGSGSLYALDEANVRHFKLISELSTSNSYELFRGVLGILDRGDYEIFVGYLPEGESSLGQIIYSAEPIRLSVR